MNYLLFITVILMDLLAGMEFDLFVPSFPELERHFQLTPFWVEATLSVNFIGFCISLFFVGNMADRFGRRPVILTGLVTFVVGSLLCLSAPSFYYLLAGRFLQGVGVAAPAILSFLLIADAFSLKKQQFYLAMLNGVMNISIAIAPVLGSYISLHYHWQGNFTALLLLGISVLILSIMFVPKEHVRQTTPIGYKKIFACKPLMLRVAQITVMFVPWWIVVGISPLLYMEDLGVSLSEFGYYQGSLAFFFAIGSIIYGLVMDKFDNKKMLIASNITFIVSCFLLGYLSYIDCKDALAITAIFSIFNLAQIVPTTILFPQCLNWLPDAKGRTSAIIQGGRLILSSIGLQLAGHYYTGSFQNIGLILITFIALTSLLLVLVLKRAHAMPDSTLSI